MVARWPALLVLLLACARAPDTQADAASRPVESVTPLSPPPLPGTAELSKLAPAPVVAFAVTGKGGSRSVCRIEEGTAGVRARCTPVALPDGAALRGLLAPESPSVEPLVFAETAEDVRVLELHGGAPVWSSARKGVLRDGLVLADGRLAFIVDETLVAGRPGALRASPVDAGLARLAGDSLVWYEGQDASAVLRRSRIAPDGTLGPAEELGRPAGCCDVGALDVCRAGGRVAIGLRTDSCGAVVDLDQPTSLVAWSGTHYPEEWSLSCDGRIAYTIARARDGEIDGTLRQRSCGASGCELQRGFITRLGDGGQIAAAAIGDRVAVVGLRGRRLFWRVAPLAGVRDTPDHEVTLGLDVQRVARVVPVGQQLVVFLETSAGLAAVAIAADGTATAVTW